MKQNRGQDNLTGNFCVTFIVKYFCIKLSIGLFIPNIEIYS